MKFYGIKQEKWIEEIQYQTAKIKTFLKAYLEINKTKRQYKQEWYKHLYREADIAGMDGSNSIPVAKYYIPVSVITTDLIAKEDITNLKEGLKQFVMKYMSHKFLGGTSSIYEMNKAINNINENLSSLDSWVDCGRFDFTQYKKLIKHIDYFDIKIRNFSSSYVAMEIHIFLAEDRKKDLIDIINSNYHEEHGIIYEHYSPNSKKSGAKKTISVIRFNNDFLKSELINNKLIETKWYLFNELSKYFSLILHKIHIIPPSINLFKTNISYEDKDANSFWDSVGANWFYGQLLSPSEKIFFEPMTISKKDKSKTDMIFIINEAIHTRQDAFYNFDFQATVDLAEKYEEFYKLYVAKILNNVFTTICSKYRNKTNKIKLKKSSYEKLLKIRYEFEKEFSLFRRVFQEIDWEKEKNNTTKLFPKFEGAESKTFYDYRVLTESPLIIQERIEKNRQNIEKDIEQKITITGHINDYYNEHRNYKLNIIMLIIAALTLTFVLYPRWAAELTIEIEKVIKLIFKW